MKDIMSSGIFTGNSQNLTFSYNLTHFINNFYYVAGQLVQWSLRNGGPGIPFMSGVTYDLMAGIKPENPMMELNNVADTILQTNIRKVCN